MARIRTIKPSYFTSLTVADIKDPWARILFPGLWTHADDEGRMLDDARLIRAAVFPLEEFTVADIDAMIDTLASLRLVTRYTVGGRRYLFVNGWKEHQKIDRPKPSELPPPDDPEAVIIPAPCTFDEASTNGQRTIDDQSLLERKGKEGKGMDSERAPRRRRRVDASPNTDQPSAKQRRDELWDALTDELGPAATPTERTNRGKTITELLAADATPPDIPTRCAEYRRRMPDAALTDAALRKHWSSLTPRNPIPREGFDADGNYFDPDTGAWIAASTVRTNTR